MHLVSKISTKVLRCRTLSHGGFRLYCLVSSLARVKGYCYASNRYLAKLLGLTITYIQECLKELETLGFIERITSKEGDRRIFLIEDPHQRAAHDPHQRAAHDPHQRAVGVYNNEDNGSMIIKEDNKMSGRSNLPDDPSDSPCLPKLYFKKRWPTESLPYKLGELLVDMVQKRRPGQFARYLTTDEGRYLLIQKQAYYFDAILERDGRPVEELLEVLQWSQEDDFWKGNIRSAETFRRQYGVLLKQMEEKGIGSMRVDHNSDLTQSLIRSYRGLIANPNFQPSPVQHTKFIVGAEKMVEFFHHYREVERSSWCECLTECLEKEYSDNSKPVYPGHYCSDHTWQVLMPQYLLDVGLVVWDSQEEIADVTQT